MGRSERDRKKIRGGGRGGQVGTYTCKMVSKKISKRKGKLLRR